MNYGAHQIFLEPSRYQITPHLKKEFVEYLVPQPTVESLREENEELKHKLEMFQKEFASFKSTVCFLCMCPQYIVL